MIIGVGTDLTDIGRVQKLLLQPAGDRFMERVLTPAELALAGERRGRLAEFVAGRFAAKEAVVKALGCGIGRQVGFRDVEVLPGESGRPECVISPEALQRLGLSAEKGGLRIHLSITHTAVTAAAFAVAERENG